MNEKKELDKKYLVRKVKMPDLTRMERSYILTIVTGLRVTLRNFFKKPVTVSYPEEKPFIPERFRGLHVLKRDEQGRERCTACHLCEKVCPSHCISIDPQEVPKGQEHLYPEERFAKKFDIDMLRCIFCGLCEEACPKAAIFLEKDFEFTSNKREDFIFHKERLLEVGGSPIKYVR